MEGRRWSFGEEWIYCKLAGGKPGSFPADWTSLAAPDPFLSASRGRAHFRPSELFELERLVEQIRQDKPGRDAKGEGDEVSM